MEFISQVQSFVGGVDWIAVFYFLRRLFIFLTVILAVAFVFLFMKALEFRPSFDLGKPPRLGFNVKDPEIAKGWRAIIAKSERNPPQSLTLAIIEADKFVDGVFKKMSIRGEHMADRLENLNLKDLDPKMIDRLWRAHRTRNDLVHTPDFEISVAEARRTLSVYEDFLREIGIEL